VRDAANKALLIDKAHELTGWQIEVLSGQEEARLSFLGATGMSLAEGARHILVLDIGGSSSELIRWKKGAGNRSGMRIMGGSLMAISADVGAVRAKAAGWQEEDILEALALAVQPKGDDDAATVIGVGGTITTAAAILQGCKEFDHEAVEGFEIRRGDIDWLIDELRQLNARQRCAYSPLLAHRGEIFVEGLWIVRSFFQLLSIGSLIAGTGGILKGCLLDMTLGSSSKI